MSWRAVEPSPFRGWIRWAPRSWPSPPVAYIDLATRRLVLPEAEEAGGEPPSEPPAEPGLVYLPPLGAERRGEMESLVARLAAARFPVVAHAVEGAPTPPVATGWVDPLAAWLAAESPAAWSDRQKRLVAGPIAVALPLLPGVTPADHDLEPWVAAAAELAPVAVLAVTPELQPADRRWLVARLGEAAFDAVFHGAALGEREVAARVAARGLPTVPPRPALPGDSPRLARNRELAAALREAGELALRAGAPESECAALLAASRHLDATPHDIAALTREGNLAVLSWLGPAARSLVEEWIERGASRRLDGLRRWWNGEAEA